LTPAYEVGGLVVRYGKVIAVRGLSLAAPPATITALLGPNGAGKSSLLKVLSTAVAPAEGSAWIFGHDVRDEPVQARRQIGLVFQERTLDEDFSVRQNLWFHARLFGMRAPAARREIDRVLELLHLADRRDDLVETLSGGLARRVEIARALLHGPRLLILDEPTGGLDPEARRSVWTDLRSFRADLGMTVLFSTHYLEEAEHADDIVIMNAGEVVRRGSPRALKTQALSSLDDVYTAAVCHGAS
jgi:ABC-2 type transport system ATP-binding protein